MEIDYTDADLRGLLNKLQQGSAELVRTGISFTGNSPMLPERLYHYTNANALMGIVENQEIWATDSRYLNDESELTWASSIFEEIAAPVQTASDDERYLLNQLVRSSNLTEDGVPYYICSFSEDSDELTQWRGYGSVGGSVSIGFNTQILAENFFECELVSVIYDRTEQEYIAKQVVGLILSFYRANVNDDNPASKHHLTPFCLQCFRAIASYAAIRFKSSHWKSEREWRLVASDLRMYFNSNDIHFRSSIIGLTPFIKLKPNNSFGVPKIPIDGLIVGPSQHRQLSQRAFEMYMTKQDYNLPEGVALSTVPLR